MQTNVSPKQQAPGNGWKVLLLLLVIAGGLILLSLKKPTPLSDISPAASVAASVSGKPSKRPAFVRAAKSSSPQSAEEEVAERLSAFNQNRRELAHRYAKKLGIPVPTELEQFFDAADRGNWEEVDRMYKQLQQQKQFGKGADRDALQKLFPTAQEVWGAHSSAQEWSAQALLDYGKDTLGSLGPNMVYLGGTDPGRFIPTFLNATSGDNHIVLTQNAFADGTYLDYVNFLYGDRLKMVDAEDSQGSFKQYLSDVTGRYAHDRDFPNEPKQMRPGENYNMQDGRVNVSGLPAVMSINELLLKTLQQKNPDLTFAMEESVSLPSTYNGAVPLGPLLQLGNGDSTARVTPAIASDALNYWRERVTQLTTNPDFDPTKDSERSYAHMIVAQGNLFSSQNLSTEAEQAYRLAQSLATHDIEPIAKLCDVLRRTGRAAEADSILTQFEQTNPDKATTIRALRAQ